MDQNTDRSRECIKEVEIGGRPLVFETGKIARQAGGAAIVRYEGTVVLATACSSKSEEKARDYLPLTVNYTEKYYAAGKIPGGFIKREGRPKDKEILVSRLIDRPIRPLFPKKFAREIQVLVTTISADQANPPDILAINGASLALGLSDIPLQKLIGAVRVGMAGDQYIVNPTYSQADEGRLDLVVAGTEDAIIMVEGGGDEVSEEELLGAISFAEPFIAKIIQTLKEIVEKAGKQKSEFTPPQTDENLARMIRETARPLYEEACFVPGKMKRQDALERAGLAVMEKVKEKYGEDACAHVYEGLEEVEREIVRASIIENGRRTDGRGTRDVRPISIETNLFPRTHGSALFTRGETQSIAITSLGTVSDEQRFDDIEGEGTKNFMFHYNFPPFSVGEVKSDRGPGRREIGHGNLAERSILPMMPDKEQFPYTIRVVSEITESNGSSSMASVCSGTLSLLSAGVPLKDSVAGVAMGLVYEEDGRYAVLTDILGSEDHLGDMDFKVAGTHRGITGFQMDVKISGISKAIMKEALDQAREGRIHILDKMAEVITVAGTISAYAPKILTLKIPVDKIGALIGPGGKTIRGIIEQTGADVDVENDGSVSVASKNDAEAQRAYDMVRRLTEDVEVGKVYEGQVKRIMDFGAFVEVLPGKEGLVHISQIDHRRVAKVTDVLNVGDTVTVKVTEIDAMGRINLSRKELLPKPENPEPGPPEGSERPRRDDGDRSRRDGPRRDGFRRDDRPRREGSRGEGSGSRGSRPR
jgi:polyribonucleotide nucleotidyltransferase